jgi:nitrogen-specific signal transduction histidine kinase
LDFGPIFAMDCFRYTTQVHENDSWSGADVYRLLTLVHRESQSTAEILEALPFGLAVARGTGEIVTANRRYQDMAGPSLYGVPAFEDAVTQVFRSGSSHATRLPGKIKALPATVHRFRNETVLIVLDEEHERRANTADQELLAVIEAPAYLHVEHTGVTAANDAFKKLTGYTGEQLLGIQPVQIHGPGVWPWIFESGSRRTEIRARTGETLPVSVRITRLDRPGRNAAVVAVQQQCDDQCGTGADVIPALQEVCGRVAHHLNNSLMMVLSATESLSGNFGSIPAIRSDLDAISHACDGTSRMASLLLSFSEGRPAVLVPIPAEETIRAAEPIIRSATNGKKVETITDAPGVYVRLAPGDLETIAANLAQNAAEATGENGFIRIETTRIDPEYLLHNQILQKHKLSDTPHFRLRVRDNGRGVPTAQRHRVFEPFFTTKSGKMGLGLSAVFGIVKRAGGVVTFNSELGVGTTVDVLLPVAD